MATTTTSTLRQLLTDMENAKGTMRKIDEQKAALHSMAGEGTHKMSIVIRNELAIHDATPMFQYTTTDATKRRALISTLRESLSLEYAVAQRAYEHCHAKFLELAPTVK